MESFENYIYENKAVKETISRLPLRHRSLIKGYEVRFETGNTLKDDPGHVGRVYIGGKDRTITIASPWRWGREFVLLHEVGHFVWEKYLKGKDLEKKWNILSKKHKKQTGESNSEECFCYCYANYYSKNKVVKYNNPECQEFIDKLPK